LNLVKYDRTFNAIQKQVWIAPCLHDVLNWIKCHDPHTRERMPKKRRLADLTCTNK